MKVWELKWKDYNLCGQKGFIKDMYIRRFPIVDKSNTIIHNGDIFGFVCKREEITMENQRPISGMSIASLVLGIIGMVICCCHPIIGFICSVVGLVLGISGYRQSNTGLGIAGIIVCIIALLLNIVIWILKALFWRIFEAIMSFLGLL